MPTPRPGRFARRPHSSRRGWPLAGLGLAVLGCQHDKPVPGDSDSGSGWVDDTGTPPAFDFSAMETAVKHDLRGSYASGASVAILYQGEVIYAQGFGSADPDGDQEVLPTTLFEIGSDTKKLTAIALLQKVESGAISLDDTVSDALGGFQFATTGGTGTEDWASTTTLGQLISHQGGLYDYLPWNSTSDDADLADYTYGSYQAENWAMFPGGAMWNYANPNFSLVGLAAERLDTRAYPDIMNEDVFAALGMTRTFARKSEAEAAGDYAIGYGLKLNGDLDLDPWANPADISVGTVSFENTQDAAWCRPAGGTTWSTPTDMLKVAQFLMHGDESVLADDLRELITSPQVRLYPALADETYGYGLIQLTGGYLGDSYYTLPIWEHGGNTLTHTSTFYILPDQDFAISVLSNGYGDDFTSTVVAAIQAVVPLPEPSSAPVYPTDQGDVDRYAGTYTDHLLGDIIVTSDGTDLSVSIPRLDELGYTVSPTLTPNITGVYMATIAGSSYDLTFIDGPDGTPEYLRNRLFVGTRVADPAGPSAPRSTAHPERARPRLTRADVDRLLIQASLDKPPSPFGLWRP